MQSPHPLRAALDAHRAALGLPALGYPDPEPAPATTEERAEHLAATRAAIEAAVVALAEEQEQAPDVMAALRAPGWVRVAVLRRGYWTEGSALTREACRIASEFRRAAIAAALVDPVPVY